MDFTRTPGPRNVLVRFTLIPNSRRTARRSSRGLKKLMKSRVQRWRARDPFGFAKAPSLWGKTRWRGGGRFPVLRRAPGADSRVSNRGRRRAGSRPHDHPRGYPSALTSGTPADMTPIGRLIAWWRSRKPAGADAQRIIRKSSDRGEPQPVPDPIEELAEFIGQTEPGDPLSRGKPTTARRTRSRPR